MRNIVRDNFCIHGLPSMHQSGSAGNLAGSTRARKEKRFTYVLNGGDSTKHSSAVNCLAVFKPSFADGYNYLFTGSRDGTLKRWALCKETATCSATFESHTDWVNDVIIIGDKTLISCSSDTTVKIWDCFSGGSCCRTLHQHSDYVNCLAAAEENRTLFASGGLGGEVFIWDVEASVAPLIKSDDQAEGDSSQSNGYVSIAAKGHKESVYALAMNHTGTLLVSGGTEKVVRVWDPRTGSKSMKLRGNTDNIRALLLDSTGRFFLSGSSDSMIRLWDLGQQRCVHSYSVHTDSVWALSSTPSFRHIYSGGRDMSLYLTDLDTRESLLLCRKEHPILSLKLLDNCIWVASTDSSVERWPAEGCNPRSLFERGGSFLAGNFPFSRARVALDGQTPVPVYEEPLSTIIGSPSMVQHEILNNRRHVLTKDTAGSVKLWEITRGFMVADYGQVSFEEKKEELSEMISVPAWFTADTRLGSLSINLDTPQCFSAEAYSEDLNIVGKSEDDKVNLGQETLKGLLAHWLIQRSQRIGCRPLTNNDMPSGRDIIGKRLSNSRTVDETSENDVMVYPPFEFSTVSPPSIITEGSQGVPWRKKITDLDGSEDEKDFPMWCLDCVLHSHLPSRDNTKCYFYLQPSEDSPLQIPSQGKLNAPRIFRIYKVVTYIIEKMVLEKQLDSMDGDGTLAVGSKPWQKLRHSIKILCNNEILTPDMSLATIRAYIWKKPEDIVLNYRIGRDR